MMKKNHGVTLVALTITIIVLLILAGITISVLRPDNGIIDNAMKAKSATELAQLKAEILEKWYKVEYDNAKNYLEFGEMADPFEEQLKEDDSQATARYKEENETIEISYKGGFFELNEKGQLTTNRANAEEIIAAAWNKINNDDNKYPSMEDKLAGLADELGIPQDSVHYDNETGIITIDDYNGYPYYIDADGNVTAGEPAEIEKANVTIETQPQGVELFAGNNAELSVEATGVGTVLYQWYSTSSSSAVGGNKINGATSTSLLFRPAQSSDNKYYYCEITSKANGKTTSKRTNAVHLNVVTRMTDDSVSVPSETITVAEGEELSIPVTVNSDGGIVSYQWYHNTENSNTGGTQVGTNSATFTKSPASADVEGYYYCVVTQTVAGESNTVKTGTVKVEIDANQTITLVGTSGEATYNTTSTFTATLNSNKTVSGTWSAVSENTSNVTVENISSTAGTSNTPVTITYKGINATNASTTITVTFTPTNAPSSAVTENFTVTKVNPKSVENLTIELTEGGNPVTNNTYSYTGSTIIPTVTVKDGADTLSAGTDYTVVVTNNINVGTATVTVTGTGNYNSGTTKQVTFTINKKSVSENDIQIILSETSYNYDGSEHKPSVTVKDTSINASQGGVELTLNTDYTIAFPEDMTSAGEKTITITGKGNYSEETTKTATYTITKAQATNPTITAYEGTYDGTAHTITVANNHVGGTVEYSTNNGSNWSTDKPTRTDVGTTEVKIRVKGDANHTDSDWATSSITINPRSIGENYITIAYSPTTYTYTGTAQTPSTVTVTDTGINSPEGTVLAQGTDYTVSYDNDVTSEGTKTITITGTGNYNQTNSATYTIGKKAITSNDITITLSETQYVYNKGAQTPTITVRDTTRNTDLTANQDYTITLPEDMTSAGEKTITIAGAGNYTGTTTKTYTITPKSATGLTITLSQYSYVYDGTPKTPQVTVKDGDDTLTENTDYTVEITNNTNVGTATVTITGAGNYDSTTTKTENYSITVKDSSGLSIILTEGGNEVTTGTYTYDGTAKTPSVEVRDTDRNVTLTEGVDYILTITGNTEAGTATVTITGAGNYSPETSSTTNFTINKRELTVTAGSASKVYNGTALTKNEVTITSGTLAEGQNFTGTASGTITNVGSVDNVVATAEVRAEGQDVTANYQITTQKGTLTVTKASPELAISSNTGNVNYNSEVSFTATATSTPAVNGTLAVTSGDATHVTIQSGNGEITNAVAKTITYKGISATTESTEITVTFTPTDTNNYNTATATYTVTAVNKIDATNPSTVTAYSGTYDGNAHSVTVSNDYIGGTLKYRYSTNSGSTWSSWSTDIPTRTEAGDTLVQLFVEGDNNHNNSSPIQSNIHLNASAITVQHSGYSGTYDGQEHRATLTVSVPSSGYEIWYSTNITLHAGNYQSGTQLDSTHYPARTNAGTTTVHWWVNPGVDNYAGNGYTDAITITPKSISGNRITVTPTPSSYTYTGSSQIPAIEVKDLDIGGAQGTVLVAGTDYTITNPQDSISQGLKTITITGKGNYSTSTTNSTTYTIGKKRFDTEDIVITLNATEGVYNKAPHTPTVTVKDMSRGEQGVGLTLTPDTDYTVIYPEDMTSAGAKTITIEGADNYNSSTNQTKTYTITPKDVTSLTVTLSQNTFVYDGTAKEPGVTVKDGDDTLVLNRDYTLAYSDNVNVGAGTAKATITGKGNYSTSTSKTTTFSITVKDSSNLSIALTEGGNAVSGSTYTYDGTAKTPQVTVTDTDRNVDLTQGTDYTLAITNNTNAGTATVTVTGTGNYDPDKSSSTTFTINKREITVTSASDTKAYDGTALTNNTVTVTSGEVANGQTFSGTTSGTITNVGSTPNTIATAVVTVNQGGADVTANYTITQQTGTLTITSVTTNINYTNPGSMVNGNTVNFTAQSNPSISGSWAITVGSNLTLNSNASQSGTSATINYTANTVGTANVQITFTPTDTNYAEKTVSFTQRITAANYQVGSTKYTTLADAYNAGNEITVLRNCDDSSNVTVTKTVNLHLGEFTIDRQGTITVSDNGNMTVTATTGGMVVPSEEILFWVRGGTLTIAGGTFDYAQGDNFAGATINIAGGTVNIGREEDTFSETSPFISGREYGIIKTSGTWNFYNGIIRGSAIKGAYNSGYTSVRASFEVATKTENGYNIAYLKPNITYTNPGSMVKGNTVNFTATIGIQGSWEITVGSNLTLNSNTTQTGTSATINYTANTVGTANVSITFRPTNTNYSEKTVSYTQTITAANYQVDSTNYTTLADAYNAGNEITVLQNCDDSSQVTVTKTVSLDLGEFTIGRAGSIVVSDNGNMTVTGTTGGMLVTEGQSVFRVSGGDLTIVGGYFGNYSGDIEGGYGVRVEGGTVNIGREQDGLSETSPVLSGKNYGIIKTSGTWNFYNGIVRGASYNEGYSGDYTGVRANYEVATKIEDGYKVAYLKLAKHITLSETSGTVTFGSNLTPTATVVGITALTATSANSSVATAEVTAVANNSATLTIHPVGVGTTTITVQDTESDESATYTVTVQAGQASSILVPNTEGTTAEEKSPYVNYTDANGNTQLCRVLYNDNTKGVQIITDGAPTTVTLGYNDPTITNENITDWFDYYGGEQYTSTTGTDLENWKKASASYNRAVTTLNEKAESYLKTNDGIAVSARSVGSNPINPEDIRGYSTNTSTQEYVETYGWNGIYKSGHVEDDDRSRILNLGIKNIGQDYWTAFMSYFGYGASNISGNGSWFRNSSGTFITGNADYMSIFINYSSGEVEGRNITKYLRPVFTLASDVRVVGGSGTSTDPYILAPAESAKVYLSASSGSMYANTTKELYISKTAQAGTVTASTSNSSVATATVSGNKLIITGVGAGTATITVTEGTSNQTATYTVTVTNTSITASPSAITAYAGGSAQTVTLTGTNAGIYKIVTAPNSATATARINGNTLTVTPVAVGTTSVVAKECNGNRTTTVNITVTAVGDIVAEPTAVTAYVGGSDKTVALSTTNGGTFSIDSSVTTNTAVATVSLSGSTLTIHPVGAGATSVKIKESNGNKTITIPISVDTTSITPPSQVNVYAGGASATTTITGFNMGTLSITNGDSATVKDTEYATATLNQSTNEITITPKSTSGSFSVTITEANGNKTATLSVTIIPTSCTVSPSTVTAYIGGSAQTVTLGGTNAGSFTMANVSAGGSYSTSYSEPNGSFTASISGTTLTITPGTVATQNPITLTIKESNGNSTNTVIINIQQPSFSDLIDYGSSSTAVTEPWWPNDNYTILEDSIDDGLCVRDGSGNDWTWVVVPKSVTDGSATIADDANPTGSALETALMDYADDVVTDRGDYTDTHYSDAQTGLTQTQYNDKKRAMLNGIKQYGGFWIGKYEVGSANIRRSGNSGTTDTPLIQQDKYPYTYVTCSQANTLAMQLATQAGGDGSLLFGTQWDLTLKYLVESGAITTTPTNQVMSDSTDWGNYKNKALTIPSKLGCANPYNSSPTWSTVTSKNNSTSMLLTTGAVESLTNKKNIVDLAGNVLEWTMEYTSNTDYPCATRGGLYNDRGNNTPASYRSSNATASSYNSGGFRPCMYAPAPASTITFTIDGIEYTAEEGMTWYEWVNSDYNTGGYNVTNGGFVYKGKAISMEGGTYVYAYSSDIVQSNRSWDLAFGSMGAICYINGRWW